MNEDKPTITLPLEDVVKSVLMLEDAIDILVISAKMFVVQKDSFSEPGIVNSAEDKVSLKKVDNGIKTLKTKILCRQFFLRDFKEHVNKTGIDIDVEIEKYKESLEGE